MVARRHKWHTGWRALTRCLENTGGTAHAGRRQTKVTNGADKSVCGIRRWALDVRGRSSHDKAACVLANKIARICHATLRDHAPFDEAGRPATDLSTIMANRVHLTQHNADNSWGSTTAACKVWRRGDADSFGATGHSRSHTRCRIGDCRCSTHWSPTGQVFSVEGESL